MAQEPVVQPNRRTVLQVGAATVGAHLATANQSPGALNVETLALLGGPRAVRVSAGDASKWPRFGASEEQAVLALLRRPTYDPIQALEGEWKDYFGFPFAKSFCNGTSALTSMFFALDLPPGSEILVPSYTFFASIIPMRHFDLVPVFVDINPRTLNFDLDDAKRRLTKNVRGVLPIHWFGLPCDMDAINAWAQEKGLIVLEDAAHAHGAKLQGKYMGQWGRMGMFSYQMSKPLPSMEGGMGVYQEQEDFDRATAFAHYNQCSGKYARYRGTGLGMKLRMHPMAAALARCQLQKLAGRNSSGLEQTRRLNDRLIQLPGLYDQQTRSDCERLYYGNNVLFIDESQAGMSRAACVKALRAEGVAARSYTYPLQHEMTVYSESQWWHHQPVIGQLPGSTQANETAIALPYFTKNVPELVDQYALAFEKVWSHRQQLS